MSRFASVVALCALIAVSVAELTVSESKKVVLASFGESSTSLTFLFKGVGAKDAFEIKPECDFDVVRTESGGYTNYTVPLTLDNGVGVKEYTMTVSAEGGEPEVASGMVTVAGFDITEGGEIVSGTGGGVSVEEGKDYSYDVKAVGTDGRDADLSSCEISYKKSVGVYEKEIEDASLSGSEFSFTVAGRVASSKIIVTFECESIEYAGEFFETELHVSVTGSGGSSSGDLARDNVSDLPSSESEATFTASIRCVDSDPTLLSTADATAILDKFCAIVGGKSCAYDSIRKGSAIVGCGALIGEENAEQAKDDLSACFDDCSCQKDLGYECDKLQLEGTELLSPKALTGTVATAASSAGLAVWAIILIAVVGAFAIILLIVLSLWAVYRRSAEQSESDYSSSGPLGVPDPSDLLYEQSIVRDIYGRGDFPEGGPSAAAAEQRAREADLREDVPRPPSSSSGISRGARSDDASSTYSV